jgi:RNA 3'-terminal phosphate cyclase (ATP)
MVNARAKRDKPGLRPQHLRVVEAIAELVDGRTEGLVQGSREFTFQPSQLKTERYSHWDIGSARSTTMLVLGLLPVLAFAGSPVTVELRGGLFQGFAPSAFHLQHVLLHLVRDMGLRAELEIACPGYLPLGGGILRPVVTPLIQPFRTVIKEGTGPVTKIWGIALSSHLEERQVSRRMAESAQDVLRDSGCEADIEIVTIRNHRSAGPRWHSSPIKEKRYDLAHWILVEKGGVDRQTCCETIAR